MTPWVEEEPMLMMPRPTPAVVFLLVATVAAYVIQLLGERFLGSLLILSSGHPVSAMDTYDAWFGLSRLFVLHGYLWQFVTYMFLHGDVMHLLVNMLGLYFMGPDVERSVGVRRFLVIYFACGVIGGAGWLLISGSGVGLCIGASGAILGVVGCFAALFPRRQITLLVFYVLPVTMTARTMAVGLGLLSVLLLLGTQAGGIAHAAHLAGGVTGYVYGASLRRRYAMGLYDYQPDDSPATGPGWTARLRQRLGTMFARMRRGKPTAEEVDRVLDKVVESGFSSLTRRERGILERASGKARRVTRDARPGPRM